jgi:hypothetical protein
MFDPDHAVEIPSSNKKVDFAQVTQQPANDWDEGMYDADEKNCEACTMLNPISATMCCVCGTPF